jgi:hypothetical protein
MNNAIKVKPIVSRLSLKKAPLTLVRAEMNDITIN